MKKTIKALMILISILILVIFMVACSGTKSYAEQNYPIKIWLQNRNGKMETYLIIDEDTGVNYIVVTGINYGNGIGTSITPRLNSDGTLYTDD